MQPLSISPVPTLVVALVGLPTVDVFVTGCFSGAPIILTKSLHIGVQKKLQRKVMLDAIPEDETT